jgi:hypothetical protein
MASPLRKARRQNWFGPLLESSPVQNSAQQLINLAQSGELQASTKNLGQELLRPLGSACGAKISLPLNSIERLCTVIDRTKQRGHQLPKP